jgi:hypothetical protein
MGAWSIDIYEELCFSTLALAFVALLRLPVIVENAALR